MMLALPEASVDPLPLPLSVGLPDPNDMHVLEAAVIGQCTDLITANLQDFPSDQLTLCGPIRAIHPDAFLLALLAVDHHRVLDTVIATRRKLIRSPMTPTEGIRAIFNGK